MASHKITEIVGQKHWQKDDIKVVFWTVKCEGLDKPVNFGRKPGNEPKVGDTLDGDFTDDGKQFKFKKANNFNGRGGMSPEQQKAIVRQHSQDMALRYMDVKGITDFKLDDSFRKVIDWFEKDASA